MNTHFIVYVADQSASTAFYRAILQMAPRLDVPGMTEFQLSPTSVLGLMPEKGIKRLLGEAINDPSKASGIPRCELYLRVDDPAAYHARAIAAGAKELSPLLPRDWGETVSYVADPDGHVVAFST